MNTTYPISAVTANRTYQNDINGVEIKLGDTVMAFQRQYITKEVEEDVHECIKEIAPSDDIDHSGIVEFSNFGFQIKYDRMDDAGVVSRRMDSHIYVYLIA